MLFLHVISQSIRASFCFCSSIRQILYENLHLQVFMAQLVPSPTHNIRQPSCLFVPFHLLQRNRSINICGFQFTFLLPELFMLIFLSFFFFLLTSASVAFSRRSSRRVLIVLETFTSRFTKFVDLQGHITPNHA